MFLFFFIIIIILFVQFYFVICSLLFVLCSFHLHSVLSDKKKVQVGKDQEKVQSERDSHSKNRGGKKTN